MTKQNLKFFNIRVYALIINNQNQILLSDEFVLKRHLTKFPGGGLKLGEGLIDALKREALEELNQEIEVCEHFYTLDYFTTPIHRNDCQLITVYYLAKIVGTQNFNTSQKAHDYHPPTEGKQSLRWQELSTLKPQDLSLKTDQKVAEKLIAKYNKTNT